MKDLRLEFPLKLMALLFEVSTSGFYRWVKRKPSRREQEEPRLRLEVKATHKRTRGVYGAERLQSDLTDHGVSIGVHRVKRIRKDLGIFCKQKKVYKKTTDSGHKQPVAENHLNQQFTATYPTLYNERKKQYPRGDIDVACHLNLRHSIWQWQL